MANLVIRTMTPKDRKTVHAIMRRSFPVFLQLFLSLSKDTLIAESEGKILGGIVLKTFNLPKGNQGGVVDWIFTDPEARGLGAGQALMAAGLSWLEDAGCSQIFAIVEGFNTSSSKLFATRGFSILPFREQLRRFGLFGLFRVWFKSSHILDIGHFLWGKPATTLPDRPTPQFLVTLILNALVAVLAAWRGWGFSQPRMTPRWALPLVPLSLIGVRTVAMQIAASQKGLNLRFRLWESGFPLSISLALAFGFFFPVPGSLYPKRSVWRYRDQRSKYGVVGLAGALPALLTAWVTFILLRVSSASPEVSTLLSLFFEGALFFAVFDVLLIFFPFVSFNGRRIWDWHKPVWILCALSIAALILAVSFL